MVLKDCKINGENTTIISSNNEKEIIAEREPITKEELKAVVDILNKEWDNESDNVTIIHDNNIYNFQFNKELTKIVSAHKYSNIKPISMDIVK